MAKYIDKDAVLAEIERYKHKADERLKIKNRTLAEDLKDSALQNLCGNLMHFLDTLDVKDGVVKDGVVTSDSYIKFSDGTCVDYDPSMQMTPAFTGLRCGDKVKVLVTKE